MSVTQEDVETKADSPLEFTQQKVYDWRLETFEKIGFTGAIAEALAGSKADLTVARRMHERGATLAVILKILM
jgi:hypothetical protein